MSREWQPGDVALVECSDGEWRQAICEPHPNYTSVFVWRFPDRVYRSQYDSNARPLVVIDPEDRRVASRVAQSAARAAGVDPGVDIRGVIGAVQTEFRALANPEPPEVFEHYSVAFLTGVGSGTTHALCGKIWKTGGDVKVTGKCPECADLMARGWTA